VQRRLLDHRDEAMGGWTPLHDEELCNLYSSPHVYTWNDQVKDEMGRACNMHGEKRNAYKVLIGKSPLGKPRSGRII
jgi:hypothetical protein